MDGKDVINTTLNQVMDPQGNLKVNLYGNR